MKLKTLLFTIFFLLIGGNSFVFATQECVSHSSSSKHVQKKEYKQRVAKTKSPKNTIGKWDWLGIVLLSILIGLISLVLAIIFLILGLLVNSALLIVSYVFWGILLVCLILILIGFTQ